MSIVKRFGLVHDSGGNRIAEDKFGPYVRHEDYDALQRRCRALEQQNHRCADFEARVHARETTRICKTWADAIQTRDLDDCLSRGIAMIEEERDALRAKVEEDAEHF